MCVSIDPAIFIAHVLDAGGAQPMDFRRLRRIRDSVSVKLANSRTPIAVEWTRDAVLDSLETFSVYLKREGQTVAKRSLDHSQRSDYAWFLDEDTPEEIREPLKTAIHASLSEV
jgi:hypothetical protein